MKKIFFFVLFFYILAILQSSFFIHFRFFGGVANFILIAVILVNFFENPKKNLGLFIAGIGGFYLDVFSDFYIGTSVFLLIFLSFLAKKILDFFHQRKVIHFLLIFFLVFIPYTFGVLFVDASVKSSFAFSCCLTELSLADIIYNLLIGTFCFYLIKLCFPKVLEE